MNENGFITPILAVSIMMTTLLMVAFAYTSIIRINVRLENTAEPLVELVESQNEKVRQGVF